jgi:hypothetical protein
MVLHLFFITCLRSTDAFRLLLTIVNDFLHLEIYWKSSLAAYWWRRKPNMTLALKNLAHCFYGKRNALRFPLRYGQSPSVTAMMG